MCVAIEVRPRSEQRKVRLRLAEVVQAYGSLNRYDGTFTNRQGRVQRIRRAVPRAGDSLPGWEIISLLSDRLGIPMEFSAGGPVPARDRAPTARAVFLEAKQKMPFMKDADWGRTSLPVQLRFANSRG